MAAGLDDCEVVVVFARYVYVSMPPQVAEDMYCDVLDAAEAVVRESADKVLHDRDVRWKFITRGGEPADTVSVVADEVGADLVVIGRHGWGSLRELLLGSVSNRLAHRSTRPVMLVGSNNT